MVMPNIGAFIAWGFVTALFIPSGWWPNTQMARLVDPMLTYLLPLLIAYTAGRNVAGERGGVIGAIAAMGVIVGSDIPMFIGAMVMGPLGGYTIRWFDKLTQGRIKAGFEMLVSNFSIGILGMLLAILGYWVIGGAVTGLTLLVSNGVEVVIRHGLLPLVSLLVEPSKVLFLNNALNHGIFSPIGIEQARETGQSIMFLLETNPGPGLGVLLACWFFGRGNMRQSAPGAVIIQFCGGIHEIYFPYILARPVLIVAAIAGSAAGLLFFSLTDAGLVAPASPGSILSVLAMAPKGKTLIVLLGAAAWFLLSYYFVRADALRVVRCTTEELTVALESGDKAADFRLTCSDMYGNSYPATAADGQYVFTGLSENTQYTITVTAADGHRLSSRGVSTLSVTTPEATEITDLTASLGDADGSVVLSFSANGPTPAQWTVSYAAGDGQKQSQQFTGNTVTVTGLTLQQNYTFTLEGTDTVFLTGTTTTEFKPIPVVKVDKLNVSSIEGNTVTVTWETGENIPAGWTVTCEARQFTTVTQTVTESSCVFELPDLKRDYTFTVSAEGMPAPAVLTLPANPLVVTGLQATANEDGTITASWQTASGAPAGGWYVTYGVPTSNHEPRLQECTENSVTLKGLIPDADYTISLTPADGADVFGTVEASAKTPSGGRFDRYGATPSTTYISLWETPAEVNWDYRSLTTSKTSFSADEDIALCLELTRKEDSDDEITLLYVIRNANGEPVSDASAQLTWDQMWHERRHTSTIPNPGAAGEYTLEVYVNRQLLKSIDFAIS